MSPKFQYTRLQSGQFRLMILQPGGPADDITCEIITAELDGKRPNYEALSYAWHQSVNSNAEDLKSSGLTRTSTTSQPRTIYCRARTINITSNLHDALVQFRDQRTQRIIWIDSICINQDNTDERSGQVRRMAHIYGQAESVIIWLGKDHGFARRAFHALERIHGVSGSGPLDHELEDLETLSSLSWFSRAWVVQEVAMAQKAVAVCGSYSLDFSILQGGCNRVEIFLANYSTSRDRMRPALSLCRNVSLYSRHSRAFNERLKTEREWIHRQNELELPTWDLVQFGHQLHALRGCSATDPRDKVYAFLSLSFGPLPPHLEADYSTSVEDLFIAVAEAILSSKSMDALSVLHFVQNTKTKITEDKTSWVSNGRNTAYFDRSSLSRLEGNETLPSWVPDWRKSPKMITLGTSNCKATGEARYPSISISIGPTGGRHLTVQGARLSNIVEISSGHMIKFKPREDFVLHLNLNGLIPYGTYPGSSRPYADVFKAVRSGDLYRCTQCFGKGDRCKPPKQDLMAHRTKDGFELKDGHNLVLTSDGRLGWVPSAAQEGDEICLLFGARVPFVIRKLGNGNYELIGEALIYGIMHGEVMSVYLKEKRMKGKTIQIIDKAKAENITFE